MPAFWPCWATPSPPTISPAGNIKRDSPAGRYLLERGVETKEFNLRPRRGNHEVMMRGTFANIRIRNEMVPGTEGVYPAYPFAKRDDDL